MNNAILTCRYFSHSGLLLKDIPALPSQILKITKLREEIKTTKLKKYYFILNSFTWFFVGFLFLIAIYSVS